MLQLFGLFLVTVPFLSPSLVGAPGEDISGPVERKALDQEIHNLLRDVINRGADLYNRGDTNGCYRLYEGSLMSIRALADHHADWQKAIADGFKQAEETPQLFQRAFVLRKVIDRIRDDSRPPSKSETPASQRIQP
jgi:hypothetical protein